jgi:collagen beta-1,O-galactosyltransferase
MRKQQSMHVFVINLNRRPDRLAAVTAALPPAWLSSSSASSTTTVEFTTEWSGPVDGERLQSEADLKAAGIALYPGWQLPDSENEWWNRPMKKGEVGCSYSHLSVWRRARNLFEQDETLNHVVVLEDDVHCGDEQGRATMPDKLERVIEQLKNANIIWDLLYLGRVLQGGRRDFPVSSNKCVVEPGFSYCTYGYVLSRTGVERLLSTDFQEAIIPVDEFLAACYTMHPRSDIAQLYPPILRAYSVDPYLIFQRTKMDGGSDTEQSALFTK